MRDANIRPYVEWRVAPPVTLPVASSGNANGGRPQHAFQHHPNNSHGNNGNNRGPHGGGGKNDGGGAGARMEAAPTAAAGATRAAAAREAIATAIADRACPAFTIPAATRPRFRPAI